MNMRFPGGAGLDAALERGLAAFRREAGAAGTRHCSQTRPRLSGASSLARFGARVMVEGGCVLWSFVYLVVRNLFALVWLLGRPRRSKELEILVLAMSWRSSTESPRGRR
jgi:hypothetical protein